MPRGQAGIPPEDPKDLVEAQEPQPVADDATTAADDAAPSPAEPETTEPKVHQPLEFAREFRRHTRTGRIFAVELVMGRLHAVRELTRPEEMTHGALPVITLYTGPAVDEYRQIQGGCEAWEPKHTPESAIRRMGVIEEEIADIDAKIARLADRQKKLKTDREHRLAELRRLIRDTRVGQLDLIASAEEGPNAEGPSVTEPSDDAPSAEAEPEAEQPEPAGEPA